MAFKKGEPRPMNAGIKKGSTWAKTQRLDGYQNMAIYLRSKGINVADKILELLQSGTLEPKDAMRGWLELAKYVYERPKEQVEIEVAEPIKYVTITHQEIIEAVKKDPFIEEPK